MHRISVTAARYSFVDVAVLVAAAVIKFCWYARMNLDEVFLPTPPSSPGIVAVGSAGSPRVLTPRLRSRTHTHDHAKSCTPVHRDSTVEVTLSLEQSHAYLMPRDRTPARIPTRRENGVT